MAYFIIIHGPLGVGKTTVSKKLAQILDAEYISVDKILSDNNLDIIEPEPLGCISLENFTKANKIIIPQAKKMLANNKSVIIDGAFYHKEALKDLIDNLPFKHYIFTLKAPVEICIQRDKNRDKALGEEAARAVYSLVSGLDYGQNIDATKNIQEIIEEITSTTT